jgi:hypothetical protein
MWMGGTIPLGYDVKDRKLIIQTATVRRLQGVRAADVGEEGEVIVQQAPVSVGREALVTKAGDYRLFFGWRITQTG